MRNSKKVLISSAFLAILSSCGSKVKSVDYYKDHLDEAKHLTNTCWINIAAADKKTRENCNNAIDAISIKTNEELAKIPYGKYKIDPTIYP